MKTAVPYGLDNENFVMGYRTQTEWRWLISTAFFLGGLGGGTFMVSLFTSFTWAAIVGWLIAVVGKGTAHLLYLGNPLRFWRAVMRPQTSWISRGMLGMLGLVVFGAVYIGIRGEVLPGAGTGAETLFAVLAGIAAAVVMIYDGFVLATPPSIPLWHSALLPVLVAAYSLLGGATLALVMAEAGARGAAEVPVGALHNLHLIMVVFNFVVLALLLSVSWNASVTARESVILLLQRYGWVFFGGVVLVGLLVTGILSLTISDPSGGALIAIAVCELIGDFLVWFTILNVGVYQPINPRASFAR